MSVSIVIPGIRAEKWFTTYFQIQKSCGSLDFEVIFVSPRSSLPDELAGFDNIKFIEDYGCPSRALQIGSTYATKEYILWLCDDIDNMKENVIEKNIDKITLDTDIVNFIYTEGHAYQCGADDRINRPQVWFRARHHDDLRLPKIAEDWYIAPIFMMKTKYWNLLGGIDCRYETINLNLHDLVFRAQKNGSALKFSDGVLVNLSWQDGKQNNRENICPIYKAFFENDLPLFREEYNNGKDLEISIDINNWKQSNPRWPRRWDANPTE